MDGAGGVEWQVVETSCSRWQAQPFKRIQNKTDFVCRPLKIKSQFFGTRNRQFPSRRRNLIEKPFGENESAVAGDAAHHPLQLSFQIR